MHHARSYRVHDALAVGRKLNFSHQVNHVIDPKTLELHDSQVTSVEVKPKTRQVVIEIYAYLSEASKNRVELKLLFDGVNHFTQCMSFEHMAQNFSAGNINYWVPSTNGGYTYIYLVNGIFVIEHKRLVVISDGSLSTIQS